MSNGQIMLSKYKKIQVFIKNYITWQAKFLSTMITIWISVHPHKIPRFFRYKYIIAFLYKKFKFLLRIILLGKPYFYLPYDMYFLNSIKDNWS